MASQVACTSWQDSGKDPDQAYHVRVYQSDGTTVTERAVDTPGSWAPGALSVPGSSVGVTSWVESSGRARIRVYVSNDGKIIEHCYDGGDWYIGGFGKATGAVGISADAISYFNNAGKYRINVYVQKVDNTVEEYCFHEGGKGWRRGAYSD